jgi:hypothetical protein
MLLQQEIMRAGLDLRVQVPLRCAALEERLVGLRKGVLDHDQRNGMGRRGIHDAENIAQVPWRMGDGQQARKIFILDIDDDKRSFHGSLLLVTCVLLRDNVAATPGQQTGVDTRATPGT